MTPFTESMLPEKYEELTDVPSITYHFHPHLPTQTSSNL
jgi:hypothetical protein